VSAIQLQLGWNCSADGIMLLAVGVQDDDPQVGSTREQNLKPVHSKTQDYVESGCSYKTQNRTNMEPSEPSLVVSD